MQTQNQLLAGLATLSETNFIASIVMARRMQISHEELAHAVATERESVKAQFFKPGK